MPLPSVSTRSRLIAAALAAVAIGSLWAFERPGAAGAEDLLIDRARLVPEAEAAHLTRYHGFLLQDHDIDYRVEIGAAPIGDIEAYAAQRFAELGVGRRSRSGRGLLLVVDTRRHLVRLEVGRALEGVYTDAFVTYVQHRQMVPFFGTGRVADGIVATTELIVSKAQTARENSAFAAVDPDPATLGGGATARTGRGADRKTSDGPRAGDVAAAPTPEATLAAYLAAMRARNARSDLGIYSDRTVRMLSRWTVTPAQMDMVGRTYRRCHPEAARYNPARTLAVIRYPISERRCSPWFFRREKGAWKLDLTAMQRLIRFGRSNAWRFARRAGHEYDFAFLDWRYDRYGFPIRPRSN